MLTSKDTGLASKTMEMKKKTTIKKKWDKSCRPFIDRINYWAKLRV